MSQQHLFDAMGAIYEAALDPELWGVALDAVNEAIGAQASALLIHGNDARPYEVNALSRAYREFIERPEGQHYLRALRSHEAPDWDAFSRQPVGRPFPDVAVGITRECLDNRPDCIALERYVGVRRRLGLRLNMTPAWFDGMTIGFRPDLADVPLQAITALETLVPHLSRSIQMGRTFGELRARYQAVLTVLDRVAIGLGIALPDGQLIVKNAEAERILSTRDGIALDKLGRLTHPSEKKTDAIQRAICEAAATARGESNRTETLMTLPRRAHNTSLILDITPVQDSKQELDMTLQAALITVIDPEHRRSFRLGPFSRLYGLSPAESEVCQMLLAGNDIDKIAEQRGTARITAKNQVTHLLHKAGARNRFDLVRRIVRTLPPFE